MRHITWVSVSQFTDCHVWHNKDVRAQTLAAIYNLKAKWQYGHSSTKNTHFFVGLEFKKPRSFGKRLITSISQEWKGTVHIAPILKQKCHLSRRLRAPLKQFTELLHQWHLHIYCFLLYSRTDFWLVSLKCQYFQRKTPIKLKKRVIRIDLYFFMLQHNLVPELVF